jgi:hypothetical protein
MTAAGDMSNSGGRHTAAFYGIGPLASDGSNTPLSLNATAGITTMRFIVDNKLEDQGGLGFALQDSVVLSASSCIDFANNGSITGRLDIAVRVVSKLSRYVTQRSMPMLTVQMQVRNNVNPKRLYIAADTIDDTGRPIVVEIDVPRPSEAAATTAAYTIWSVPVDQNRTFGFYSIEADVDGDEGAVTLNGPRVQLFSLPSCASVSKAPISAN